MIFFKVIVVVSIIIKKCVIVIVSIIHFLSIVPSSAYSILLCYFTYFLLFLVYGLQVREQSAVRGRKIIEWEGRQVRSNESRSGVYRRELMSLFVGVWVGSSSGKGQRGQRSVYLKNGVCINGEW